MELRELKYWYSRYQYFWTQWKEYRFNGLSKRDISAIELYRDSNFIINTSRLEAFYTKGQIIECLETALVKKFRKNYTEFKEWVTNRFRGFIFKKGLRYGLEAFLTLPIERLKIEKSLKDKFKTFNCLSIGGILELYTDSDYFKEDIFNKIMRFEDAIQSIGVSDRIDLTRMRVA